MPELTTENLLAGMLHNRLGRTLLRYAGFGLTEPVAALALQRSGSALRRPSTILPCLLPAFSALTGRRSRPAGVRTDEFDPETLQSRLVPGLYAAGEVLDIDGDCGGYNLQWAWSSGHLAWPEKRNIVIVKNQGNGITVPLIFILNQSEPVQ